MERCESTIEFSLRLYGEPMLNIRLRRLSAGWVADVLDVGFAPGVGRSARQALTAALQPLGDSAVRTLFADLGLLGPSLAVANAEKAARVG